MTKTETKTLRELYKEIDLLKHQIEAIEKEKKEEYFRSCRKIKLPKELELNLRDTLDSVLDVDYDGKVTLSNIDQPWCLNGMNEKFFKAGSQFVVITSWKTGKNTKGTHYLLCTPRTRYVCNYYGNLE